MLDAISEHNITSYSPPIKIFQPDILRQKHSIAPQPHTENAFARFCVMRTASSWILSLASMLCSSRNQRPQISKTLVPCLPARYEAHPAMAVVQGSYSHVVGYCTRNLKSVSRA
jgi:hypothetical protein